MAGGSPRQSGRAARREHTIWAIDASAEFTEQMLPNLEQALKHPDMTEELADVFSTLIELKYRIESDVRIKD